MAKKSKKTKKVKAIPATEVKRGRGRPKKVVESLPEPIPTPVPVPVVAAPVEEPEPVITKLPKLTYQIVLELEGKNEPVVFTKNTEFTDPVTKTLVTESMTENRQAVERTLQEYVSKNPELFEGKKGPIYKVMTAGGAQNAFVKKG